MSDLVVIFHLKFPVFTNADLFHKVQNKKHSSFEGNKKILYNIFFLFYFIHNATLRKPLMVLAATLQQCVL